MIWLQGCPSKEMEAMDDATCIHMQLGAVEDTYEMTSVHFDVSVLEAC